MPSVYDMLLSIKKDLPSTLLFKFPQAQVAQYRYPRPKSIRGKKSGNMKARLEQANQKAPQR